MPHRSTGNGELIEALRHHVWAISAEIGERSALRGDGLENAERYIHRAFEAAGLTVTAQPYDYGDRRVANLIADLPSTSEGSAIYIIGAHYDSVIGTPGADDNASAIAVMLELARRAVAEPPQVPVQFVAFTLEEPPTFGTPHQGSRVFASRLKRQDTHVSGAVVLEMVGFTTPKQVYPPFLRWAGYPETGDFIGIIGNGASRAFGRQIIDGMRKNSALPVESLFVWFNGWLLPDTRLSDHSSFWDRGIPALMVTDTAYFRNPNYHGPGDRAETLDYAFMAELVLSLELAIRNLPASR